MHVFNASASSNMLFFTCIQLTEEEGSPVVNAQDSV